jgi:general secretion pathway protein I
MSTALKRSPGSGRQRQAGFTLLEAVVALALVAAAALPLYALFSRSLDGLFRAAEVNRESEAALAAIAFLGGVNPMDRPQGEEPMGPYRIVWTSRELVPAGDAIGYPRGLSLYQVALYEVTGAVTREGRTWFTTSLRQVGFRKVREMLPFAAPAAPSRG